MAQLPISPPSTNILPLITVLNTFKVPATLFEVASIPSTMPQGARPNGDGRNAVRVIHLIIGYFTTDFDT